MLWNTAKDESPAFLYLQKSVMQKANFTQLTQNFDMGYMYWHVQTADLIDQVV